MPKKAESKGAARAWSSRRGGGRKAGGGDGGGNGGNMKAYRGLFRQRKAARSGGNRRGGCGPRVLTLLVSLMSLGAFMLLRV